MVRETEGGTTDWNDATQQSERLKRDRFIARDYLIMNYVILIKT